MKCLAALVLLPPLLLLLALPSNAFIPSQQQTREQAHALYNAEAPTQCTEADRRRPLIAGRLNNLPTQQQALALAIGIANAITVDTPSDVALFVPFSYLGAVQKAVGDKIIVGAEMLTPQDSTSRPPPPSFLPGNQSWAPGGDALQNKEHDSLLPKLEAMGIQWSMAGFAEERSLHAVGDDSSTSSVNAHCLRMIANGMNVVLCLHETMEDFQQDRVGPIFEAQLKRELAGVSADGVMNKVTIIYEPHWSSSNTDGTPSPEEGRPRESPELAQATLDVCRHVLAILYSPQVANATRILYGGAAIGSGGNSIDAFMAMPDIDGALVGASSVEDFKRIVNFQALRKPPNALKKWWSRITKGSSKT